MGSRKTVDTSHAANKVVEQVKRSTDKVLIFKVDFEKVTIGVTGTLWKSMIGLIEALWTRLY